MLQPNTMFQLINIFLRSLFGSISDRLLGLLLFGDKITLFFPNNSSSSHNPPLGNILHVAIKTQGREAAWSIFRWSHLPNSGDLCKCLLPTDRNSLFSAKHLSQFHNPLASQHRHIYTPSLTPSFYTLSSIPSFLLLSCLHDSEQILGGSR